MRFLVDALEMAGYRWAYRVVDARAFSVPQRRRRVLLLASRSDSPSEVLLADDAGGPKPPVNRRTARGFYWTEGRTGLGWAVGAVPTLKGGSSIGIPSPPAIWFPARRTLVTPDIRDAERLQGFDVDWTKSAAIEHGRGARWKLVGNAVCVPMMTWLGSRLMAPGSYDASADKRWDGASPWPQAAWGGNGAVHASRASAWPLATVCPTLSAFLQYPTVPLSHRATSGFFSRALSSGLRFEDGFLKDVAHHLESVQASSRGNPATR